MNFNEYLQYMHDVVERPQDFETYQDEMHFNFASLNLSRTNRWLKKFVLTEQLKERLKAVQSPQHWIILTEPWCGDAAHSVPMLYQMSLENKLIQLDVQLRDEAPFLIDKYLTNGAKSIPKLIVRNEAGEDLAVWGPRTAAGTALFEELKQQAVPMDTIKTEIQRWYNVDKGDSLQAEMAQLLDSISK